MGYAKGIWQFIPQTAELYGLKPGPLKNVGKYDAQDERFHFQKAHESCGQVYQATSTIPMPRHRDCCDSIVQLGRRKRDQHYPEDAEESERERNLWQLLKQYKIPQETYDYVFYIFSAAVIAENPRLFGFDFQNPFGEQVRGGK